MVNKAYYTAEVPEDRFEVLNYIKEAQKPLKIMIIGGIDSGKTTLSTFLSNDLLKL